MFDALRRDVRTVLERDPAARSPLEVLLCYPGVHALAFHRFAHRLWNRGWTTTARFASHVARVLTGDYSIYGRGPTGPGLLLRRCDGQRFTEWPRAGGEVAGPCRKVEPFRPCPDGCHASAVVTLYRRAIDIERPGLRVG